jgi:transposase-like protein
MGRPSQYSTELIEAICERLSNGEPLAQICRDDGMPKVTTLWNWMNDQQDVERASFVSESIARAREAGEEQMALDCLNIADNNGKDMRVLESGMEVVDSDVVQRAKLRIDTRLKLLAKWNPKKWGEKQSVDMNVTTTEVEFK